MFERTPDRFQQFATRTPSSARFKIDTTGTDQQYGTLTPSSARFKIDATGLQQHDMEPDNRIMNVIDVILQGAKAEPLPKAQALRLTFFNECSTTAPKHWLIKGVVALGETSSWIAPPGKGKSALQTDISVAIAAGMDWRGHRSKGRHGVVYFAFERGDLVKRRLAAYAKRHNLEGLPIAVASQIIDLMQQNCVEVISATIRDAEQRFDVPVGYIVIDTFAKGIAAGGGDEDKARDQNKCLTNLRRLHERAALHVAIVGHTGKDETKGSRGSNAHPADVDLQVQISGDEIKFARVIKGNDQPEGDLTAFKLETAELGLDEDGDPITTAILSDQVLKTGITANEPKLSKNQQTMFSLLHSAGAGGLTTEEWNQKARDVEIGTRRKADLYDIRLSLKAKNLIRQYGERWTVAA